MQKRRFRGSLHLVDLPLYLLALARLPRGYGPDGAMAFCGDAGRDGPGRSNRSARRHQRR